MKTQNKKVAFMVIIALFIQVNAWAKDKTAWTFSKTTDNVDLYYSIGSCKGEQVVFLKFVNHNKTNVSISWKDVLQTQTGSGEKAFRGIQNLILAPGVTMNEDCSANHIPACILRSTEVSLTHRVEIRKFDFENVTV